MPESGTIHMQGPGFHMARPKSGDTNPCALPPHAGKAVPPASTTTQTHLTSPHLRSTGNGKRHQYQSHYIKPLKSPSISKMSSNKEKSEPPNDDAMAGNDDKPRLTEEEKKQNHIASGEIPLVPFAFLFLTRDCRAKATAGDS